jgi:hypothetical protein
MLVSEVLCTYGVLNLVVTQSVFTKKKMKLFFN